jgi:hypothetical protein
MKQDGWMDVKKILQPQDEVKVLVSMVFWK